MRDLGGDVSSSDAYSAVYSRQSYNANKGRVRSFSHFLPGWFNTKEVQVEVIVEQNPNEDYYDVTEDSSGTAEAEHLLTSYKARGPCPAYTM